MLKKTLHEIRDPIHNFITLNDQERDLINSRPFQRLRHIHQLGMSHFLYPGANHTRFEHSLGVMELASQVFDRVTSQRYEDEITEALPELSPDELAYWRRVLRMAALCHDLGHLPFSHVAEASMLPEGCDHESLSIRFIQSQELSQIWSSARPPLNADDIIKLAVGPKKLQDVSFSSFEAILAEIITGDAFGVDRADYLLRDSLHAGVAYGRFDHHRLIHTLRIMPPPPESEGQGSAEPTLGIEEGGLHAAEALLLARYFMFTQMYLHPVRRIYDRHLVAFLKAWLPGGQFAQDLDEYVRLTDHEVMAALLAAQADSTSPLHELALQITSRRHFRRIYTPSPTELADIRDPADLVGQALAAELGTPNVIVDTVPAKSAELDFPVLCDGGPASARTRSQVVQSLPHVRADYVFVHPDLRQQAQQWLATNLDGTLKGTECNE